MQRINIADFLSVVPTDLIHPTNSVALRKRRFRWEGRGRKEQNGKALLETECQGLSAEALTSPREASAHRLPFFWEGRKEAFRGRKGDEPFQGKACLKFS